MTESQSFSPALKRPIQLKQLISHSLGRD
uniref:Uncharacterized protein n=1 Tax=Anguilla anguilla TaxID=7936 RepID=A0A0E9PB36_ANGAN